MKLINTDKGKQLIVKTNASRHYDLKVEIFGEAGAVIKEKAYYRSFNLPAKEELKFYLKRYKVPEGYLSFRVEVGGLKKQKRTFNSQESKSAFNKKLKLHKKKIAVWHQKEKRALFKTIGNHKDYALQLSSLIPLNRKSGRRFRKAYAQWKNTVLANRSNYLKTINSKANGKFVYPKIWLKLKDQESQLLNLSNKQPSFDYASFKAKATSLEKKVLKLSLW